MHDRIAAMSFLQQHAAKGQIVTGLLYVENEPEDLHAHLQHGRRPAQHAQRGGALPRPATLEKINASLRYAIVIALTD